MTSASRPGRSVATRLSNVRSPASGHRQLPPAARSGNVAGAAAARDAPDGSSSRSGVASAAASMLLDLVRRRDCAGLRRAPLRRCRRHRPRGPSNRRACWIARPSRSSVATMAANRPSRSGECTNTSSAPACAHQRTRARRSVVALRRSAQRCRPATRLRRGGRAGTRPRASARTALRSRAPRCRRRPAAARAASRVSRDALVRWRAGVPARAAAPGAWRGTGRPAAGPSMRSTVSARCRRCRRRSAGTAGPGARGRRPRVAKRWITSGSPMSCFCAVTDISRWLRTSHSTSAVSPGDRPCATAELARVDARRARNDRRRGPWRCRGTGPASSSSSGLRRRGQTSCAIEKRSSARAARESRDVAQHRERVLVDGVDMEQVELHAPGHLRERRHPARRARPAAPCASAFPPVAARAAAP